MLNRDRRCVFVGDTMAAAVVTATWLTSQGIGAQVMDMMTLGGLEGLTGWAPGISARGMEVWVDDPTRADEAREILAEHQASRAEHAAAAEQRGPVTVACEECGRTSIFPPNQYGTTQDCPHCGAYMDVVLPGQAEPWEASDADDPEV
jgi:hypothetical protein